MKAKIKTILPILFGLSLYLFIGYIIMSEVFDRDPLALISAIIAFPLFIVFVFGLLVFIFSGIDKLISDKFRDAKEWLNQPDPTNRQRANALNVDFVDDSVHYTAKRLGENTAIEFPNRGEKGRFIIDGDYITVGDIAFQKNDIQWLGLRKKSTFVRLDVNIDGWWYQISINPINNGEAFLKELRKLIPEKLKRSRYMYRPEVRTYVGKKAHITAQNLQGIFKKHEEVELHVTPLWMVVLHNGRVIQQHFIDDIADIRSTKHPTDLDDDMQLLTFEAGEKAFAYALKDKTFVTRLSDATKEGVDSEATRKKKKQDAS